MYVLVVDVCGDEKASRRMDGNCPAWSARCPSRPGPRWRSGQRPLISRLVPPTLRASPLSPLPVSVFSAVAGQSSRMGRSSAPWLSAAVRRNKTTRCWGRTACALTYTGPTLAGCKRPAVARTRGEDSSARGFPTSRGAVLRVRDESIANASWSAVTMAVARSAGLRSRPCLAAAKRVKFSQAGGDAADFPGAAKRRHSDRRVAPGPSPVRQSRDVSGQRHKAAYYFSRSHRR